MAENMLGTTIAEERFEQVLAEILRNEEEGTPIDLEQAVQTYPDLESSLREFFRNRAAFDRVAPILAPTAPPPATPDLPAGSRVDGYEIIEEIDRGGRGIVYRVRDAELHRSLAVKVLLPSLRDDADAVRRFLEERQVTGQLQHPGIVPVHSVGNLPDGRPYFAMKLVQGRTLSALLAERLPAASQQRKQGSGSVDLEDSAHPTQTDLPGFLGIFQQICHAVAYAHSRGVIHRDLKPNNVMVGAFGEVQVMDWGLAKVLSDPASGGRQPADDGASVVQTVRTTEPVQASQAGAVMGTYAYMPPEQARGEVDRLDERCDVFGLGAILCVILTGQPPYTGPTRKELMRQAQECDLTDAEARLAQCGADSELIELTRKCLAPDREERPRDAAAVAQVVTAYRAAVQERLRAAELAAARAAAKTAEERKRRRLAVGFAGAVLMTLLIGGGTSGWWLWQRQLTRHDVEPILADTEAILRQPEKDVRLAERQLDQAEARLAGGGPADLRQRLEARRRDLEMAKRLDAASLRATSVLEGKFDFRGGDQAYGAAFTEFGLDVSSASEEGASEAIRRSPISNRLLVALDSWAFCKDKIVPNGGTELRTLANSVDDDAWRRRLRSAVETSNFAELEQLACDEHTLEEPPTNLKLLGWALYRIRNFRSAENWLRKANERHPEDFSISLLLASSLQAKEPPEPAEAIRFLQAAVALQPRNPAAFEQRGTAWAQRKEYDRAIRDFDEAIRLDPNYASAFIGRGNAWRNKKNYAYAMRDYDEAIRLDPNYARAFNSRGIAWSDKNDKDRAVRDYDEAIRLDPSYASAFNNRGNTWRDKKDYDRAMRDYDEAIRLDPNLATAFTGRGNAWRDKRDYDRAIRDYDEAIRLDPNYAPAFDSRGNAWSEKKEYDRAIRDYEQAMRLDPSDAIAFSNRGNAWRHKKDYDRAMRDYDEAIRLDPNYAPAFNNRGNAWRDKKDYDRAIRDFDEAIRLDPDLAAAFNNRGVGWYDKKQYDRAMRDYDEAIRLDPNYAPAFDNRGNAWRDKKDYDRAMRDYDEAIRLDRNYAPAFNSRGVAWYNKKDYDRAMRDFDEAIRLDPNDAPAFNNRGFGWYDKKQYDRAMRDYDEAIRLDPNFAMAFSNRGNVWRNCKDYERAMRDYNEAIRLDPNLALAFNNRGNAWKDKRVYDEAIKDYDEAIRLDPNYAIAFSNRGSAWRDKKDYDRAIRDYDEAIRLDPNYAYAFNSRGSAWRDRKDYDRAISDFDKAIRLDPKYALAFNNRGTAWSEKKDYDRAMRDYDEAIRLDPNLAMAFSNRGIEWKRKKEYDRAIRDYDEAIRLDPTYAIAFNNRGSTFFTLKRFARAEVDFRKAVNLSPKYFDAWVGLGFSLRDQGQFADARDAFRSCLELTQDGTSLRNGCLHEIQMCENLIVLEKKLSDLLNGEVRQADASESIQLAHLCRKYRTQYAAAARFYAQAFEAQPDFAKDRKAGHLHDAACAAAQAGCGQGKDADTLDAKDRPRLRKQALDWLRADLAFWAKQAESQKKDDRAMVVQVLKHWQEDADLAGVRDKSALEKLPDAERAEWEKLWADVAALLEVAQEKSK
jgi:tetratricopeptide (TPR) repeat protein/tRNA A-37 threonylcarbamoyl transferase component Bud32